VDRQSRLFAEAEAICTLHGAALTNLVWCKPGCRVLELVADTFVNGVYEGIAEQVGVEHHFLLCPGDSAFRARVDMKRLVEHIKAIDSAG
jgi:capsular polysaccharide biosynthesis protein